MKEHKNTSQQTDLIFHLGYDKCASSTLQDSVFPQTKGYLGAGLNTPLKHKFAKTFQALAPCGPSIVGSIKQARIWAEQVYNIKQSEFPEVNRLILSSEFYIMNNIFKTRPIIPFLKKINDQVWHHGEIKIIVIIRNQAEKLASLYAQSSIANPNASQADFEKFCVGDVRRFYENMNYSKCIEELHEAFGKDKVCVLLMEDIGKIEFWEKLKQFSDLAEFNPGDMVKGKKVNQRKLSKNIWKLQNYSNDTRAKYKVNNYFKFFWPAFIAATTRKKAFELSKSLLKKLYSDKKNKSAQHQESIYLSEAVKSAIQKHYKDSNQKLSDLLDRDLKSLGYL
jgi:hypothetical protein